MKLRIYPHAVVRIPKISFEKDLESCWKELKYMINDASPEFYSIIENLDYSDLHKVPTRVQQTIWKYFNRARFRATPFGVFASTGCISLADHKEKAPIRYQGQIVHEFVDWSLIEKEDQFEHLDKSSFTSNSSYYVIGEEIRYLRRQGEQFEIATIEHDPLVLEILIYTTAPKHYAELISFVNTRLSSPAEIDSLVYDLLEQQLLLSSVSASIIGTDYFDLRGHKQPNDVPKYRIAESVLDTQSYDINIFRHLPAATVLLNKLSVSGVPEDLKAFAERFFHKFEQANIPLMIALDPEIGVGYAFSEQLAGAPDDQIAKLRSIEASSQQSQARNIQKFQSLYSETVIKKQVNLEDLVQNTGSIKLAANSLSAICTIADGMVWLQYLGGATANALLGRFTPAVATIKTMCNEITEIEKQANPNVIFFDIGYVNEIKVDNINRRERIYDLQVNILNYDSNNRSLPISDIFMCVKNSKIILYSKTLNKRLVPRMASAYNYKRSTLPLFRMLCDLMFQDVQGDLMFRPSSIYSGQDFYPRVLYKNIVVSPAYWRLEWQTIHAAPAELLKTEIENRGIPRYIRTGFADQTLLYDTSNPEDLHILADSIRKQGELLLAECPLPEKNIVQDQSKDNYLTEFIISLVHNNPVILPFSPTINNGEQFKLWLTPGKEWLYFEIYLSHFRSDEILINKIIPFIKRNKSKIVSWFFIRYDEGGEHIRLRLKVNTPVDSTYLIEHLSHVLDIEFRAGIIFDLKICTYKKEIHRYGRENMEKVEEHFCFDSEFVSMVLAEPLSKNQKYYHCLQMLLQFHDRKIMDLTDFESMVEKIVATLSGEHELNPEKYRLMNTMYAQLNNSDEILLNRKNTESYDLLVDSFFRTVSYCKKESRKILLADLMHMHVNRIFNTDQRSHELIIFYFLQKELKKRKYQVKAWIKS
ncbi:thiopeptide-type bacteriocin biosynthesis protein [Sphingobacterium detergens]|uniref:Thiopeptide-type bacteriocin biosynthesis protein n=2 Tax=Sphingobacterium detergens TaxID=1145106 RepID=A0A420B6S8_SPHD1|nr:thiopeptide-type bacteriocin biosynthesis protein [Sphingobacterium detergens]